MGNVQNPAVVGSKHDIEHAPIPHRHILEKTAANSAQVPLQEVAIIRSAPVNQVGFSFVVRYNIEQTFQTEHFIFCYCYSGWVVCADVR